MNPGLVVTRRAHAKINLALAVGPAEGEKGRHPIASWMAPLDLCDDLTLTCLEPDRASRYAIVWAPGAPRTSAVDWPITKDLAVRAHMLLEHELGRRMTVQMKLEKRVPVGGGLGGGSSDAAAMLLALREMFALDVTLDDLRDLSKELGADVAYFIDERVDDAHDDRPRPALVEGFGDRLERTGPVDAHAVLVAPPFGCPTGPVYRAFDELGTGPLRAAEVRAMAKVGRVDPSALFNDLAAAAERIAPDLAPMRAAVSRAAGRPAHVTGSGSAMFVLADDRAHAAALAQTIAHETSCAAVPVRVG